MSFLKRLGSRRSKKTDDAPDGDDDSGGKKKSQKSKREGSFNVTVTPREDEDRPTGDALRTVEEEKEKDKERKKYKDMSGLLVGQQESVTYPNFLVHYLGRIPTSSEYGRAAVEEPVNQLCKLREKQKLQRVALTFNVEGLYCREVSGPFFKQKKDGFNMHIPLHHITYGVGCTAHPTVFACVAKMNDDPNPANQVLVLHGFVCDKPETTQAVTYWQLQAYIEAYEDLKRKRILRARRKQALEGSPMALQNQKITEKPMTVPEEDGPEGSVKASKHSHGPTTAAPSEGALESPVKASKHSKKRPTNNGTDGPMTAPSSSEGALESSVRSSKHSIKHSTNNNVQPKTTLIENPAPAKETKSTTAESNTEPGLPQLPRLRLHSAKSRQEAQQQQTAADVHPNHSQANHHQQHAADSSRRLHVVRKPSNASTGSGASYESSSGSSGHGGGEGSPMVSPAATGGKTNKTFEKRIDELNTLVNMDAEKLKLLMINDHPTLARRIYYRATVDQSGVFHQGDEEEEDTEDSHA
ncbi:uncharacterized protein [Amphiura filiformis]|uniref:uncharacterized protein n=1 Tax=Amphiura filiformis TaxID=82378 RepID=UPI003B210DE8